MHDEESYYFDSSFLYAWAQSNKGDVHTLKAHELARILREHPKQAYLFTDGQDEFDDLPGVEKLLTNEPGSLTLEHSYMEGMDYLYHYREPDIFNLKRLDVQVPLAPIDEDIT